MSDGIAEMEKEKSALYTHTDGEKHARVICDSLLVCEGCFFHGAEDCVETDNCTGIIYKPITSPLATASAELASQGRPLVAESIMRGAKEAIIAEGERTFHKDEDKVSVPLNTDSVRDPSHYADSYPCGIEVFHMINILMTQLDLSELNDYQKYQLGNVFKYRLRAGYKDDGGETWGNVDLRKAMRCREMIDEGPSQPYEATGINLCLTCRKDGFACDDCFEHSNWEARK